MLLQFLTLGKDKHIGKLSTDLEAHTMPYDSKDVLQGASA